MTDRSLLAKDFKAGQLPAGAKGDKGDTGDPATSLFAAVQPDGQLIYGRGVSGSTQGGPGVYTVTFTRDLTNCVLQATAGVGHPSSVPGAGGSTSTSTAGTATASIAGDGSSVLVDTSSGGAISSLSFMVAAFC